MAESTNGRGQRHTLTLDDCARLQISGVLDVDNYDETTVTAHTVHGILTVEGEGLHVRHLALESGEMSVEGSVRALYYSEESRAKAGGGGFFARLLR